MPLLCDSNFADEAAVPNDELVEERAETPLFTFFWLLLFFVSNFSYGYSRVSCNVRVCVSCWDCKLRKWNGFNCEFFCCDFCAKFPSNAKKKNDFPNAEQQEAKNIKITARNVLITQLVRVKKGELVDEA